MHDKIGKAEKIYRLFSHKISSGEWKSGQLINENKIAREMEINRASVREALSRLITEGLIEKRENMRKYVATIHKHEKDELAEYRAVIEAGAAWLTAKNGNDKDIDELGKLIKDHYYFFEREYRDLTNEIEARFHNLIVMQSKNKYLIDSYMHSKIALHIRIQEDEKESKHELEAIKQHEKIVEAIKDKDSTRAFITALEHLLGSQAQPPEDNGNGQN